MFFFDYVNVRGIDVLYHLECRPRYQDCRVIKAIGSNVFEEECKNYFEISFTFFEYLFSFSGHREHCEEVLQLRELSH